MMSSTSILQGFMAIQNIVSLRTAFGAWRNFRSEQQQLMVSSVDSFGTEVHDQALCEQVTLISCS